MLPKSKRASKDDFKLMEKADVYSSNIMFSLKAKKQKLANSKISFSVSKKVSKSAVVRNKLRRFGYRVARALIDKIDNHIIIVYFKIIPKDFIEVEKSLEELLTKSKIIKK